MSPKSRGRPTGRGKSKKHRPQPAVRQLQLQPADHLIRQAAAIVDEADALSAERWASEWLGQEWASAPMGQRQAEHLLCVQVVDRARARPSRNALAAVAALRRVAPENEFALLDEAIEVLSADLVPPIWSAAPPFEPVRAWRAVNVWDSERVLFVEYGAAEGGLLPAHTLMAHVSQIGTTMADSLGILLPEAATTWSTLQDPEDPPMPVLEAPLAEVLAEMADSLRTADLMWPRVDDQDFVEVRALAWTRCRAHLPALLTDFVHLADTERDALIEEFLADDIVTTSELAEVDEDVLFHLAFQFLHYGDGCLHDRPFGWSPEAVAAFMTDWLPRKVTLNAEERRHLPDLLRLWLRFGLRRRGVAERWIIPVVAEVG